MVSAVVLACALIAAPAQATEPTIATDGASATGSTYALVEGNGSAEGVATTFHADYASAGESWCPSHGAEGTPRETGPKPLGSGNAEISEIHVELSGLEPGSEYCTEMVAENSDGTAHGAQVYFSTPVPPSVSAEAASQITASDATLEATIEPKGSEETTYEFFLEAPSCASYGVGFCEASGGVPIFKGSLPAGSDTKTVSVDLADVGKTLAANTIYGYRVEATRGVAASSGELKTFTTPEETPVPAGGGGGSTSNSSGSQTTGSQTTDWQTFIPPTSQTTLPYALPEIYGKAPAKGHSKGKRVVKHKRHKHHKPKGKRRHHKARKG